MKSNKKGFIDITIIMILAIGLIGGASWYVLKYKNKKSAIDNTSQTTQKQQAVVPEQQETTPTQQEVAPKKIDTTVYDVNISLKSEADLAKLPDYTPATFKSYLAEQLRYNKPHYFGENIVALTWKISKISQVNIEGAQVDTDENGNGYPGGAGAVWAMTPAGTWDRETLNGPVCISKNGGKIYEEFVPTCYDDAHPDGIKNPNGSIKLLAQ
jgi:hypothetical protein